MIREISLQQFFSVFTPSFFASYSAGAFARLYGGKYCGENFNEIPVVLDSAEYCVTEIIILLNVFFFFMSYVRYSQEGKFRDLLK